MFCLYGYILFQFWFHPSPFPNDPNSHAALPDTRSQLPVTLNIQEAFDVPLRFKPLCHFHWYMSHTGVTRSHYWFVEVPSCFFSWCKFTIEQIYCNLGVNSCFPTEWERGQQNSNGRLAIETLHEQHASSQKQGSVSRGRKETKANPIQRSNWWSEELLENKYYKGFANPRTDLHTLRRAFLWRCVFIPLHFKAAVQGCWVLALSKWNRDYVVPYVRQLRQRIPWSNVFAFPVQREC